MWLMRPIKKTKKTNQRQRRKLEFHKQIAGMQTSRVKLM